MNHNAYIDGMEKHVGQVGSGADGVGGVQSDGSSTDSTT